MALEHMQTSYIISNVGTNLLFIPPQTCFDHCHIANGTRLHHNNGSRMSMAESPWALQPLAVNHSTPPSGNGTYLGADRDPGQARAEDVSEHPEGGDKHQELSPGAVRQELANVGKDNRHRSPHPARPRRRAKGADDA